MAGPPLAHFARRAFIAGMLPNSPDNLAYWLRFPQKVVPGNAMPDSGLNGSEARDAAAYLESLR
jgi:cytochrome c2